VTVYDLRGRQVLQLQSGWLIAGQQNLVWAGNDEMGQSVASGSYLIHCDTGSFSQTVKVTVAK